MLGFLCSLFFTNVLKYLYLVIFRRESNVPHDDPNRVEIIFQQATEITFNRAFELFPVGSAFLFSCDVDDHLKKTG